MPPEITEEQVAAGVRSFRGRCLDHGVEWRTTEPMCCQQCMEEFTAVPAADQPANPDAAKKAKK